MQTFMNISLTSLQLEFYLLEKTLELFFFKDYFPPELF